MGRQPDDCGWAAAVAAAAVAAAVAAAMFALSRVGRTPSRSSVKTDSGDDDDGWVWMMDGSKA